MGGFDPQQVAGGIERHDACAATAADDEVEGEPVLEDGSGTVAHSCDEGTLHLGTGGRAARVQHPRRRVAALPGPREPAAGDPVEHRTEGDELVDPLRALVDEHTHGRLVAQACPGAQRVGQVEVGRVLVAGKDGGNPPLRPTSGRLVELTFGYDSHAVAAPLGKAHGGRQPGHAAADDEDVETPEPAHASVLLRRRRVGPGVTAAPPSCRSSGRLPDRLRRADGAARACGLGGSKVTGSTTTA